MKSIVINYRSKSYVLEIIKGEHIEETYTRLWKIIQQEPNDDYMFEKLVDISKMWYYKNRLNCQYSENIEKLINLFNL